MLAAWQGVSKRTDASFYSWLAFYDVILQGALSRISKALQKTRPPSGRAFGGSMGGNLQVKIPEIMFFSSHESVHPLCLKDNRVRHHVRWESRR